MANTASLLLSFVCFTVLHGAVSANQADQLRRLIKPYGSRSAQNGAIEVNSLRVVADAEPFSPSQKGLMHADKIQGLPGQPEDVDFDQYGGYVTVNQERALFYYFVEAPEEPSKKPLLLWLNGGPGCSSLGYGAFEELGPFRVNPDGRTLYKAPDAWNKVANVLFLESPVGVGFSYSNASGYDINGDKRTAQDSYQFLINWLERFPQYKGRDFFMAGESHAGHYIPQLSQIILRKNKVANQPIINLKGVLLGNAYIDGPTNDMGELEFFWKHDLLSDETYGDYIKYCNPSNLEIDQNCAQAPDKARMAIGNINPYNIYAPKCGGSSSSSTSGVGMAIFDPCSDDYVHAYLNNPAVQKALHANITNIPHTWKSCNMLIWDDWPSTVLPVIKQLVKSGLRVWLFSGDIDSVVSTSATKSALKLLGLPITHPWRAWYARDQNEVGGYVVGYEGLTYVTVRGAGHEVPSFQPFRGFKVFDSFLQGKYP